MFSPLASESATQRKKARVTEVTRQEAKLCATKVAFCLYTRATIVAAARELTRALPLSS